MTFRKRVLFMTTSRMAVSAHLSHWHPVPFKKSVDGR